MGKSLLGAALAVLSTAVMAQTAPPAGDAKAGLAAYQKYGCYTCHGIVGQASGAIWIESRPGAGCTVQVLLPRAQEPAAAPGDRPDAGPQGGSETVLVVEDEDVVRRVTGRILAGLGYRVLVARDADEAERRAREAGGPIGLLLTDLVLPGRDGLEVARALGERQPGLRVLYTSGWAGRLPPGGLPCFLPKPYTPGELARAVRDALAQPCPPAAP